MSCDSNRRRLIGLAAGAAMVVAGPLRTARPAEHEEMEVLAVEDLMREHGILRRALLVYAEAAARLLKGSSEVPAEALGRTAALFRSFGEDYHERGLEEKHVFPPLLKAGGANAALARTLTVQHQRGRDITDYVAAIARRGRIGTAEARPIADTLTAFVRMYEHHAAIEDTVIFPAWKKAISAAEYRELSDQFEDLEHRFFGADGFEDALARIGLIEQAFGLADLAALTAPEPPAITTHD